MVLPAGAKETPSFREGVHEWGGGFVVGTLGLAHDRRGVLDGAWWPYSRDIAAELPALISALTEYLGPVTRVGLDAGAWDALPTRLLDDDRVVHIDSFPVGDDTVLVTRGDQDYFSLLVIPPHALDPHPDPRDQHRGFFTASRA
ncbi:DUF5994 family protein [Streptomyces griseoaurantiacus]|uniref:DUF5994 family protein n=1 Tax=Streptomyces griseoaurantiacus TaxID=68213 RepID=UPI0035ABA246